MLLGRFESSRIINRSLIQSRTTAAESTLTNKGPSSGLEKESRQTEVL